MRVRLKDIAEDLGLSAVTISKVLRHHPDISDATRKRVLERMKELNYQPNFAARSLITGRTWTMGLIVPDLLHPFFARIAKVFSSEIRKKGFSLFISSSDEDPEFEQEEITHLLARRVDMLVIASVQQRVESFRRIEEHNVPYILLDRKFPDLSANFAGVDDVAVGVLATSHLIDQGCKRIAHIRGPEVSTGEGRLDGYKQALLARGMTPLPEQVISLKMSGDHYGETCGYEAAKKLFSNRSKPDGIFCFNDPIALGAMRAILEAGMRIPEDIAIVGCGNISYDDLLRVPLSSVDHNSEVIGKRAATLALSLAHNKGTSRHKNILVPSQLIVRASSLKSAAKKRRS